MDAQRANEIQAMLEGIPLPAKRADLIRYAQEHDPSLVRDLEALPDEEFDRLDAVGDLLTMQPAAATAVAKLPRPESGKPPGGEAYLTPFAETGAIRHDAPRTRPPQDVLEQQSETQKRQQAKQEPERG
jgi:Protein of unknown function (DUF2795)